MDGHTVALASLDGLEKQEEGGLPSEMLHDTGESDVKIEEACSASWAGKADALACREACGTSTAADSPPETSPVVHVHAPLSERQADEGTSEGDVVFSGPMTCNKRSDPSQQQQLPPPAAAARVSAAEEEGTVEAVAVAEETVADETQYKSEKETESHANSLLRVSGQVASQAWESARTHAVAAASATASTVAATDFSALREVTAKPLVAAASYIGLGPLLDSSSVDPGRDAICKKTGTDAASPPLPEAAHEAVNPNVEEGTPRRAADTSSTDNRGGSASSGWLLGRLRLPAVTQWLCSTDVAWGQPLSCTVASADEETELEGSEAEAAASEYLAKLSLASATAAAEAARAGADTAAGTLHSGDSLQHEEHCTVEGSSPCTPITPKAAGSSGERLLLGASKQETAADSAAEEGGGACCTAAAAEAPLGCELLLTTPKKDSDTAIPCEHCLLPATGEEAENVTVGGTKATGTEETERPQQDQQQKQKLWKSLRSMLASTSRRSVDVVQQAATTAASAAGAASKALDGLVLPLFGTCMQPTTQVRAGNQQPGLQVENSQEGTNGEEQGQEDSLRAEEGGGEPPQTEQLTTDSSETPSRGLLTELQRRQRALAEAVRNRSTNFLQHSVALTASSSLSEARYHLAEIVDTGGPEVSGVWAGVKVGLGIATLASGHLILGGAMVAVATSSLGSALLWGRHRQEVYEIMRGDYTEDAEAPQEASENASSAEGNDEEGPENSGMLSGTAGGGTDSCLSTASPPGSAVSLASGDAGEDEDAIDSSNASINALTEEPEGGTCGAQAL